MADNQQLEVVRELHRRRDTLDQQQRAVVDELAKRFSIGNEKSVGGFVENIGSSSGKLIGDLYNAVTHPVDTVTGLAKTAAGAVELAIPGEQGHEDNARKVRDMYVQRYGSMDKAFETFYNDPAGFAGDVSMLFGGAGLVAKGAGIAAKAANATRTAQVLNKTGQVAKTVSRATDPVTAMAKTVSVPAKALGRTGGALNPTERAAIDYVRSQGAEVPAGVATGNTFVKVAQGTLEHSPGGSLVADKAKTRLGQQMEGIGRNLAAQVDPNPVTPETAGAGLRTTLQRNVDNSAVVSDVNYESLRNLEADPAHTRSVQTGTKQVEVKDPTTGQTMKMSVPVTENIALPVEVGAFKKQLKPVYEHMQKWWEPARRNASPGFTAIKSIMEGPDAVSASVAEVGLGGLKELAREGDPRNAGLAKMIIPKLEQVVDDAVGAADPRALDDLRAGRKSTATMYDTKDVLKDLRQEPVQAFGQTKYANDAGIEYLRKLSKEAPGEMPKVGRAYIEKLLDDATNGDRFDATKTLYKGWKNLGPETKKILFKNPAHIADLDKFFTAVNKLSEQVNPSRSGLTAGGLAMGSTFLGGIATGALVNLGAYGLTKILYSPKGVDLLLNGMKAPRGSAAAAHYTKRISLLAARNNPESGEKAKAKPAR